MKDVNNTILEGTEDFNKVFKHNVDLLHNRRYERCGSLVAWSVLHGGPGLPVLNRQLYQLMFGKEIQDMDIKCIADFDVKSHILQVSIQQMHCHFFQAL